MTGRTKVSVVIASWNGRHHLEHCLPELERQRVSDFDREVLVLDNASDDGSADWLRAKHPWVKVIESRRNLGFCAGNNRLVAEAEGDLVALLNNDARPDRNWLAAMVDALLSAPADVVAVSGKILDWEGERLDFGRGVLVFDGHAFQVDYHRPVADARLPAPGEELPFACGANMLLRRAAFQEAGGFDESYFAYLEDVDLGWRLWSQGGRVLFAPEGVAYHRSGATGSVLGNARRGRLIERNAFMTAYKNYEDDLLLKVLPVIQLTLMNRVRTLMAGDHLRAAELAAGLRFGPGGLLEKVRRYGVRESLSRALARLWRGTGGRLASASIPRDDRTQAHLQALAAILADLDDATRARREIQTRRRRGDREYFERFPVYLVPTYPGDEELFSSPSFWSLWPEELPVVRASLDEL